MAKIKHNSEIIDPRLPDAAPTKVGPLNVGGVVIQPGQTAEVENWEYIKRRSHGVKQWLAVGIISEVGGSSKAGEPSDDDDPELVEKRALIAELDKLGIKKTERTSLDNLRKARDEAVAPAGGVSLPGFNPPAAQ